MGKKGFLLFLACVFVFIVSGCHTVGKAAKGAGEGAKEDWENAQKTDAWMRKNLW